jgi:pimeloyl-ACP methyl ester carboxylesterase
MPKIQVNDIEMYYEISGSGLPLTLIMGLGGSARMWMELPSLFVEHFQVITFDNRGAGRSSKPQAEYSTDLFADDTYGLLKALGIDKTHVYGISMGGMIAQKLALKYPDIIDKLILGCTLPSAGYAPPGPELARDMQESMTLPQEERVGKMLNYFVSEEFIADKSRQIEKLKENMILDEKDQGVDAFMRQYTAISNHNTVGDVENIRNKTLVITGDADLMVPMKNSQYLASRIPGSELAVIPGGGHGYGFEKPAETFKIIMDFLK